MTFSSLLLMKIVLKDVCGENIKKEEMPLKQDFGPLFNALVVKTDVLLYHFCLYFHGDNAAQP